MLAKAQAHLNNNNRSKTLEIFLPNLPMLIMLINLRCTFDCMASVKSLKSTFNSTKMEFGWLEAFICNGNVPDAIVIAA